MGADADARAARRDADAREERWLTRMTLGTRDERRVRTARTRDASRSRRGRVISGLGRGGAGGREAENSGQGGQGGLGEGRREIESPQLWLNSRWRFISIPPCIPPTLQSPRTLLLALLLFLPGQNPPLFPRILPASHCVARPLGSHSPHALLSPHLTAKEDDKHVAAVAL